MASASLLDGTIGFRNTCESISPTAGNSIQSMATTTFGPSGSPIDSHSHWEVTSEDHTEDSGSYMLSRTRRDAAVHKRKPERFTETNRDQECSGGGQELEPARGLHG